MSSFDPDPRRERRAGFIMLCLIALTTAAIKLLMGIDWRPYTPYYLTFSIHQDATDIAPGTPVNVGGIRYGQVIEVDGERPKDAGAEAADDAHSAASPAFKGTWVKFELDSSIHLWSGVRIVRNASVLGGNVSLDITDAGFNPSLAVARTALAANAIIRASNPASGVAAIFGTSTANRLTNFFDSLSPFRAWIADEARQDMTARFDKISASFDLLRSNVRRDGEDWSVRLTALKSNAGELARQLGVGSDEPDPQSISAIVERAWPQIRGDAEAVKGDWAALSDEVKGRLYDKMTKTFDDFQKQFERMQAEFGTVADAGTEARAIYQQTLAEFSLCGGQISRTFDDVLGELMRALLEKPDASLISAQDRLMVLRQLAMHAEEVQRAMDDFQSFTTFMHTNSPAVAEEIRQRIGASMAELLKAIDSLNESIQKHR